MDYTRREIGKLALAGLPAAARALSPDSAFAGAFANRRSNGQGPAGVPTAQAAIDVAAIDHDRILRDAAAALRQAPIALTDYRAKLSTGGPHDFYSNGDYWWPNPDTASGLPYVQRDGQSNPGNFNSHRECLWRLRDAVTALAAAYTIAADDRYVTKAVELLRVFFLDAATLMNPSLRYAQAIPGVTEGRGIGIIDTLHLIGVPKAVLAMAASPAFPPAVLSGLRRWFAAYLQWMTTSKNGRDEAETTNNHAVAFWLQAAVFASFEGNADVLVECRRRFTDRFVSQQMAPDGSFPRELARTKPYGYSIFQLDNMATLCQVLSTPADNLWTFTLPDGRGMRKAMDFLYPYLVDKFDVAEEARRPGVGQLAGARAESALRGPRLPRSPLSRSLEGAAGRSDRSGSASEHRHPPADPLGALNPGAILSARGCGCRPPSAPRCSCA